MASAIIEAHELPLTEALLAATLALMTGYAQALQADLDPARRIGLGCRVITHLAMLGAQPQLSPGFRQMSAALRTHWHAMSACTEQALRGNAAEGAAAGSDGLTLTAPKRLQ